MLTIFANMRINSDERLRHLKESFASFETESDNWLINIRGSHREAALAFLKPRLEGRAMYFELLDDSRGWIENAREMVLHAKHPYVMYWLEDHINTAPKGHVRAVVQDMAAQGSECLLYSWWKMGWAPGKYAEQQTALGFKVHGTIESGTIDAETWKKVLAVGQAPYLVSLASIFEKEFFKRLLAFDREKLPFPWTSALYSAMTFVQNLGIDLNQKQWFNYVNSLVGFKLRRFSIETPFDLEKAPERFDILPMRAAFPVREMLVCIDDDCEPEPHGYSLVSRGEYPIDDRLVSWKPTEDSILTESFHVVLKKDEKVTERYCFYGIKNVRSTPVREYVGVVKGVIRVSVGSELLELRANEGAGFFTNIPHEILALEDSEIKRYIPKTGLAPHYFSA